MKILIQLALACCLALPCAGFAQGSQAVAFVADIQGEASSVGAKRPALMSELSIGQKLTLAANAQMSVMFLQSGKELRLRGPGEFTVGDRDIAVVSGTAPLVRETPWRANQQVVVNVARTAAASTRMRQISFIGPDYPRRGGIVALQPTLRWKFEGEKSEPLSVTLLDEAQNKVVEAVASGDEYRVPSPLEPGKRYVWLLSANGETLGEASFRLVSAAAIAQATDRRPATDAAFSDWALYALFLQELGADEDARQVWSRLARLREDLPELARLAR